MKLFQQLNTGTKVRKSQREMLLHCTGESHKLHRGNDCTSVYKVEWVSREKGEDGRPLEIREPQEKEAYTQKFFYCSWETILRPERISARLKGN